MARKKALRSESKTRVVGPNRTIGRKVTSGPRVVGRSKMPIGNTQPGYPLHGRVQRPSPRRFREGGMGKHKMSDSCLSLCRLRWQTILSHCFVAASSLRANCLVAMRSSAVSLIPHERNPGMQRYRIQKIECAESERRNARLGSETSI